LDDAVPLAGEATRGRPPEPSAQPVCQTRQAAAPADHAPAVAAQDDVDALAPEPAGLVEAVRRPARAHELPEHLESGALRRRAAASAAPRASAGQVQRTTSDAARPRAAAAATCCGTTTRTAPSFTAPPGPAAGRGEPGRSPKRRRARPPR